MAAIETDGLTKRYGDVVGTLGLTPGGLVLVAVAAAYFRRVDAP